jgi:protoporphyrinogen oxidase
METDKIVLIVGAGPAGLGAALQLTRKRLARVKVLEQSETIGGTAGSFELSGIKVDYGSHRLHPSCDPVILKDLQALMGEDLLDRPRHGRIRLHGRWIHFPLKPLDMAFQLPPGFVVGVVNDLKTKVLRKKASPSDAESFASVLQAGLGRTICRDFYFPYARKIWGLPPEDLSATQAYRRVSAGSLRKMLQKIASTIPGIGRAGSGRFFYPQHGFGQICESLMEAARNGGASFHMRTEIRSIEINGSRVNRVYCEENGKAVSYDPDYVWSTVALPDLVHLLEPQPPPLVVQASANMQYRAMILVYLLLEQDRFSEYDAHYFPEPDIPITRLSEPKNYSNRQEPRNLTVLCAELPCATTDLAWQMKDEELGGLVHRSLESAGLQIKSPVSQVVTRRLPRAYPIYRRDYEGYLSRIDEWLNGIENLLTFGRQGLFVHDNTHHALYMGYSAAGCLDPNGRFDRQRWKAFRRVFDTHVVED